MINLPHVSSESTFPFNDCQKDRLSVWNWLKYFEENGLNDFSAITKIASEICRTSIAVLAYFEGHQIFFKSRCELNGKDFERAEEICHKVSEVECSVEYLSEAGKNKFVLSVGLPLINTVGKLIGVLCIINHNSENLKESEKLALKTLAKVAVSISEFKNLSGQESITSKLLEENALIEIYLVSSANLRITFANQNALNSLGYTVKEVLEKNITEILVAKKQPGFKQQLLDLAIGKTSSFSTFVEQINSDKSKKLVKIFVSFVGEGFDSSFLIIAKNLSQAGVSSDFVDYLNDYDSITGLGNRHLFEKLVTEKIHTSINSPIESGLLLINLDNFKLLNQSFGYQIGDKIARQVSQLLIENLESNETLVHTAEDDYCIILSDCNRNQIKQKSLTLMERICNEDFSENGKKFKLQVNLGAVLLNSEICKSIDYLSIAHIVCEIAKEKGQNQFYLANPSDELFIRKHLELEQLINIQDAIERNKLILFAQKLVRVSPEANNFKEHFEILIRMKNEADEIISPAAFIPQLETHGSIVSLDKWVLKESLNLVNKRFSKLPPPHSEEGLMYNINLSSRTITDACFVKYCIDLLRDFAHIAPFICFEITETVAILNFEKVKEFIRKVRRFGCKFALDDFGAGGASLEHLKELSMDYLKIDGSFVQDIVENPISQIIVESICRVSEILKVNVIAEKVETQTVEEKLMEYGVHYIQGFKFHKPSPFVV